MKKIIVFILLCTLTFSYALPIQKSCGTPDMPDSLFQQLPWYGNENYLDNYYDSLATAMGGTQQVESLSNEIENVLPTFLHSSLHAYSRCLV